MKKILFVALAAVGLTACVQNEELAISKSNAITFDNVYVGNATKAAIDGSYTAEKGNLDHFNVWATISNTNGTANIFKNEAVTKNNAGVWSYAVENTQYWIPGNNYSFVGVVDGTVASVDSYNMPLTISTSLSGQQDVLYDTESRSYNGEAVTPVHFNFEHLLAKVKFTAKNVMTTSDSELYYTVESIKITNADNEAVYTIADEAWTASNDYTAEFGAVKNNNGETATLYYQNRAESNYELLVLPQENKSLNIVVNYTLRKKDWASWTQPYEKELTATLDIEKGRAYNFVLELGNPGAPIEFDAEVKDWVEVGDLPIENGTVVVSSAADLQSAVNNGGLIVLENDINLDELASRAADVTLTVASGKEVVINLNGKKLSATSSQNGNREMFLVKGNLTIKNGTIEYQHVGENMGWNAMTTIFDVTAGGVLNLEGVTAKNLGGSDMGFVAHLNNWGKVTLNVENSTLESNYVAVRVFNSGNDLNNVTIKSSTLKGGNYAFWVHTYTVEDFGSEAKFEAHKALLNLDVFNASNTFVGKNNTPIRFGMTNALYFGLVSTEAELKEILAAGWSVILAEDIVLAEALKVASEKNSVIDLNGHTLSGVDNGTASYGLITNNGNLTIEGPGKIQLSATNNRGWNAYSSVISNGPNGVLAVNGGTIEHLGGTDMAYGIDILTNGGIGDSHCTINGGHIKSTYRAIRQFLNSDSKMNTLVVNGGVIEGANKSIWMQDPSKKSNKGALTVAAGAQLKGDVYLFVTAGSTEWPVEVSIASAALVGESKVLTGNVPAGYMVTKDSENNYVVAQGETVSDQSALATAISAAEDGAYINLAAGSYTLPAISGKEVTLVGTEDVVITVNKPNLSGADLTLSGVTVKGSGYSTGVQHVNTVTYNDVKVIGEMCLYGEKVVFNGCTFELAKGKYIWVYGAKNAEFNNCVFNTAGKALLVYNEGAGANNVKVEGCTFNATAGDKAGAIANQNCAAIEIDNFQSSGVGVAHKVVATNNTYSEHFSGEWRIKNYVSGNTITVNGVAYSSIAIDGKTMTIDASKNVTVNE